MAETISKTADCIRNVSAWSHISPEYKIDNVKFDIESVKEALPIASPKMEALFDKIADLDEEDYKTSKTHFKHIIYTDIKGINGAKMIAAAFKANGFPMAYDKNYKLTSLKENTFALLCSSTLFGKPIGVRFRKSLLDTMNKRPDNINGKNIRFIILDQGYKEGIDLFDIKYVHLFEPQITIGDEKQAIGRGTRYCGQSGLPFHPKQGWPLYVFRYELTIPEELEKKYDAMKSFELFLKYTSINLQALIFSADLESRCIEAAVDAPLTYNVHQFDILNKKAAPKYSALLRKKIEPFERYIKKYNTKYDVKESLQCTKGCSGNILPIPTPLIMIAFIKAHSVVKDIFKERNARTKLCELLKTDTKFCKSLSTIWSYPEDFFENNELFVEEILENKDILIKYRNNIKDYLKEFKKERNYTPVPPSTKLRYNELVSYIQKYYNAYKWPLVKLQNDCISPENVKTNAFVEFTKSQDFVRHYFTPKSIYKGLLLWNSTGSGKTCTAIATATTSFEPQGYTILWVTRHTLKEDMWKNMFDSVCSLVLQERLKREDKMMPKTRTEQMKLLSNQWIMPMSYKQFGNMITGKNDFYNKLVARNGKEDILRKTLVIIDEAHKLYAPDLKTQERPNPKVLKELIHRSYTISKDNSVRILMMTATPILDDPMSLIKLLNFIRLPTEALPEDMDKFMNIYCDESGHFTGKGTEKFFNDIAGTISYLNRQRDARQFAYPVFENIFVPMSSSTIEKPNEKINELKETIENCTTKKCVSEIKREIKALERNFKNALKNDESQERGFDECLE